jgi:hypothetical protein
LRIRLLGVTASGLGEREQLSLFAADDPRRRKVTEAADEVRHRFGERAITRARLVGSRLPAPFERDPMTPVDPRSLEAADRAADGEATDRGADGEAEPDDRPDGDDGIDEIEPID